MTTHQQNGPKKLKRWELYKKEFQIPELRTEEPVGLYPRQSTKRQVKKNRQSFEKQTVDTIDELITRGWTRELIKVYDQDTGHSARRALEDREALNQMFADIRDKVICTVRVTEVDRLFRDEDRIDSNLFIKYCKEADCLVLTDRMTYDFSIPRHVDYFRDEVDRAWKFYESQILIRANEHQDRARSKGLYVGGLTAIGYIVDKNPKSQTYMHYTPYQLHAERTLEVFQWFYDCAGILGVLYDKLDSLPYVWPIEEDWVREQKAFATHLEVVYGSELDDEGNPKPIGYRISAYALKLLLRNRIYRGEWPHDGEWIPNNHTAIIPKDLADFAESVFAEREENTPEREKYHTQTTSVIHDILYAGPEDAKGRYILQSRQKIYRIIQRSGMRKTVLATVNIKDIEDIFLQKFTQRLQETQRFEGYEQKVVNDEENKKVEGRRKNLQELVHTLTERIDGLFLTLQSPKLDSQEREEFIDERHRLIKRREAAKTELNIQSPTQVYLKYKDLIDKMGRYWERYPFGDRQGLVALLVRRVYLEPLSHRFVQITVEWKEFPSDMGIIWRRHEDAMQWKDEEKQILRELYPTEPAETIQQALPHRSWNSIIAQAVHLDLSRRKRSAVARKDLSLEDREIIERYDIPLDKLSESLFTQWV